MPLAYPPSPSVTVPAIIAVHQTIPAASPQVRRRRSRLSRVTGRLALSGAAAVLLGAVLTIATSPASAQVLPPNTSSDCRGRVPIVVASDFDAQSDIYSAWTLASALDTTCVVLAGARTAPMPQDQRNRLSAAQQSGWIVGGEAAVPTWKLPIGRTDTRLAGRDRWHTAEMVGDVAAGRTAGVPATGSGVASGTEGIARQQVTNSVRQYLSDKHDADAEQRDAASDAYVRAGCDGESYRDVHHQLKCLTLLAEWNRALSVSHRSLAELSDAWGCYELAAFWRAASSTYQRDAELLEAALDAGDDLDDPRWQRWRDHDRDFDQAEANRLLVACFGSG